MIDVIESPLRDAGVGWRRAVTRMGSSSSVGGAGQGGVLVAQELERRPDLGMLPVAFIDDDAVPEPSWLCRLVAPFEDPGVAGTGGYLRGRTGISKTIKEAGATACVTGTGSMFRLHMKNQAPRNFREAYQTPSESARLKAMLDHLFDAGFLMINTCTAALSTPMTEQEIDALVALVGDEILARLGPAAGPTNSTPWAWAV